MNSDTITATVICASDGRFKLKCFAGNQLVRITRHPTFDRAKEEAVNAMWLSGTLRFGYWVAA